jgi:hypothetical protein
MCVVAKLACGGSCSRHGGVTTTQLRAQQTALATAALAPQQAAGRKPADRQAGRQAGEQAGRLQTGSLRRALSTKRRASRSNRSSDSIAACKRAAPKGHRCSNTTCVCFRANDESSNAVAGHEEGLDGPKSAFPVCNFPLHACRAARVDQPHARLHAPAQPGARTHDRTNLQVDIDLIEEALEHAEPLALQAAPCLLSDLVATMMRSEEAQPQPQYDEVGRSVGRSVN